MTNPLFALAWELYARRRAALLLAAAYTALLPLGVYLLDGRDLDLVGAGFIGFLVFPVPVFVAAVCLGGGGPLEGRPSLFPRRLFRLPVPAWALVAAPLALATVVPVVAGSAVVWALSRRHGVDVPLLWPGMLAAASVVWLQALCWSPFPLPWLRPVGLCLVVVAAVAAAANFGQLPDGVPEAALVVVLGLGYAVAHRGVRLARYGVGLDDPAEPAVAATARPAFASPFAAQRWLEWRLVQADLLVLAVTTLIWVVPVAVMVPGALQKLAGIPGVDAAVDAIGVGWLSAAAPLLMPLVFVASLGSGLGRLGGRRDRFAMPAFLATKPIDDATLLRAKYGHLALLVGAATVLGVVLALVSSVANGRLGEMAERVTQGGGPFLVGGLAGAAALAWLWAVGSLWSGLWGPWWAPLPGLVAVGVFLGAVPGGLAWLAALAVVADVAVMAPLIRRTPAWPICVALAAGAAGATLAGWWPVALVLWPAVGLPLAPVALAANRHR